MARTVHILVFDAVELLDFAGPFEVFSVAGRDGAFDVHAVAESAAPIRTRGGLTVTPDRALDEASGADVLVVPGGQGARAAMHREAVLTWVRAAADTADVVLSVCTGAFVLAQAELLDGCTVTTHHSGWDRLETLAPHAQVVRDRRFIDNGPVVTAAGISAGIDAALYVVARLCGSARAEATAHHMEYESTAWRAEAPSTGP